MYEEIFGESPRVKVINYILINPERDYTKNEIAFGSKISRVTLNSIISSLDDIGILVRKGSKYKLNTNSKIVQILLDTQIKLSEVEIDANLENYTENRTPLTEKEANELLDNFDYEPDIDKELEELDGLELYERLNNSKQQNISLTFCSPYKNEPVIEYGGEI